MQAVEKLRLRFPIAEISRETGYSEGQISRMLKNKIPTSDKFLDKFFESFNLKKEDFVPIIKDEVNEPSENYVIEKSKEVNKDYIKHYQKLLELINNRIEVLETHAADINGYKELSELIKLKAEIQKELGKV